MLAVLVGSYLFFCPCLNPGLYELVAIYPNREPVDTSTPYVMAGFIGDHRLIPCLDSAGKQIKMHGIYFKAKTNTSKAVA